MSSSPSPARDASNPTATGGLKAPARKRRDSVASRTGGAGTNSTTTSVNVAGVTTTTTSIPVEPTFEDGRITVCVRARPLSHREEKLIMASGHASDAQGNNNNVGNASFPNKTAVPHDGTPASFSWNATAGGPSCLYFFEDGKTVLAVDGGVPPSSAGLTGEQIQSMQQRRTHTFTFDHAYDSSVPQETVYADMGRPVLFSSFQGFNTCIFAYGQTGSGKSYCMMGPDGGRNASTAPGIIPRLCRDLFEKIAEAKQKNLEDIETAKEAIAAAERGDPVHKPDGTEARTDGEDAEAPAPTVLPPELDVSVYVSYLEIYREKVRCLLNPRNDNLKVRQHPQLGVYVEGLKEVPVNHEDQIVKLMKAGTESRHTASTNMNDTSSRSHAIFQVQLIQKRKSTTNDGAVKTTELRARINLVDLAGSERAKATGAEGDTLKEGAQINKSLSTLGLVISTLAEISSGGAHHSGAPTKHVPYRDSTLTYLLKESLGGNSKTYMLSTLSPATINYDETLSTLRYADRAKQIVTRAFINETASDKRIRELENEVTRLREKIQAMMARQSKNGGPHPVGTGAASGGTDGVAGPVEVTAEDNGDPQESSASRKMNASLAFDEDIGLALGSTTSREASGEPETNPPTDAVAPLNLAGLIAGRKSDSQPSDSKDGSHDYVDLDDDALGSSTAGAAIASSPTSAAAGSQARAGLDVARLQSELERAEEVIRQLTATERDREKEAGDAVAEVRAQSTVKLSRRDPYLMNLDGLGDWVVAHLVSGVVYIGAPAGPEELEAFLNEDKNNDLDDCSDHEDDDGDPDSPQERKKSQYVTVAVLAEDGDTIGFPHCKLCRSHDGETSGFTLHPCPGFDTFVNGDFNPMEEAYTLQNGDVITLGDVDVGPQVKFMDPAAAQLAEQKQQAATLSLSTTHLSHHSPTQRNAPLTARGTRTRVGAGTLNSARGTSATAGGDEAASAASPTSFAAATTFTPAANLVPALNLPGGSRRPVIQLASRTPAGPPHEADTHGGARAESHESKVSSSFYDDDEDEFADYHGGNESGTVLDAEASASMEESGLAAPAPIVPSLRLGGLTKPALTPPALAPAKPSSARKAAVGPLSKPPLRGSTTPVLSKDEEAEGFFEEDLRRNSSFSHSGGGATGGSKVSITKGSVVTTGSPGTSGGSGFVPSVVRKGRVVTAARYQDATHGSFAGQSRFVGRHTLLFLGPSGGGKTHTRENLREPDRWYDFLTKRAPPDIHPTWGVDRCVVDVDGNGNIATDANKGGLSAGNNEAVMSLALEELSGHECFSLLQDQLPSRRVTYVLCFSLGQYISLQMFRHTLEHILCQSDHRDASVVLIGTHYDSTGSTSATTGSPSIVNASNNVHRILDDLEQQVQNYFLLLQPNAELRPTIIGRFALDNALRKVYSAGFTRVSTFPELLRWFGDQAQQRCRNDIDFLNGRIPMVCTERLLPTVRGLRNVEGKWCLAASEYKARAKALDPAYHQAHTLHTHTQLLAHWGEVVHRFRHANMKAHIVVDVPWYLRLLACVACCGAASLERPDEMLLCTLPMMHAYPRQRIHFNPDAVILADAYGLLSRGVMSTKVLAAIVGPLLASDQPRPSTVAYGKKDRPDLPGIIELFQTCDYVVPGRRLCFSPDKGCPTGDAGDTKSRRGVSVPPHTSVEINALRNASPSFESFLVLPSTFYHPASAAVVQHGSSLLTGPFYRFSFSMVPPFFFAKLTCRLANDEGNGCERVYLGPVRKWLVESDGPYFPLYMGSVGDDNDAVGGRHSNMRPPPPKAAVVPGTQHFWASTAWILGAGGARALLRMVQHSLFIAFNHTSSYKAEDAAFYEDVLAAVRSVVAESPGTKCEESILCCLPSEVAFGSSLSMCGSSSKATKTSGVVDTLSSSLPPEAMLDCDPKCFYRPVTDNINSLEKIREREAHALQTARTHRPVHSVPARAGLGEEEDDSDDDEAQDEMPFIRSFSDTPLGVDRFAFLVDTTQPMRASVKEQLVMLLCLLAEARENCDDCPNDGSETAQQVAERVGQSLDTIIDLLATIR